MKSRYGPIGGIESMLEGLMPEIIRDPSIDPMVVFVSHQDDPDLEARLTANGKVPLARISWAGLPAAPLSAMRFARLIRNHKIDVIHTHDMRANLLAALSRPMLRVPWLCHVHGWLGNTHKGVYRIYEAVDRRLIGLADHVLVGSHSALEEVRRAGARSSSVAWNAVATVEPGGVSRTALGLPERAVIYTVLGRLHPGKGQDLFLDALGGISDRPGWHAAIVGTGETVESLTRQAAALGIADRVTFTGFVESSSLWIEASDVIVVPSRKESLPLTCLEGMAHSKALIVSAAGDLPSVIVDNETGLVVPIGDADALRAAICSLLDDPAARRRMGEGAHARFVTHHTAAVLAQEMAARARSLIDGK